ncbi:MAG TPA: outer membrane beta-barrel protein [Woeseiaceae bacterium]|nr:outer membrane beta-barrel protein [Woeseiaceae bacterium]
MWRSVMFLAAFSVSGAAYAEGFDYSFVEGSYGQVDFDGVDGDGMGIGGSFALTDSFHVFGGYETGDFDGGVDLNALELGVGYNMPVTDVVDFVASLSYVSAEAEVTVPGLGSISADENGYGLGVGLRGMATPQLELNGGIEYVDLDSGSDTGFGAGFLYHFSESLAVGLSGDWADDVNTYALNGRFSFGQ